MGQKVDKTLKNTSINIPKNVFERVDAFAQSVGINRNAALIYLISRGLDYEYEFEHYMAKKRKRKVNPDVVVPAIEKSARRRPYHKNYYEYSDGGGKTMLQEYQDSGKCFGCQFYRVNDVDGSRFCSFPWNDDSDDSWEYEKNCDELISF